MLIHLVFLIVESSELEAGTSPRRQSEFGQNHQLSICFTPKPHILHVFYAQRILTPTKFGHI